ncbi:cryptochrome [Tilletiaria anomala UBC 951]|uniref:Cryptochrome n=1 Tax=Tilletiaria anomala (strain ATCC 24038 / CBS 436.72 / UBC 951) TaxID=1037660 RepID=A0A066VT64_TILAU|nr:cryptochrome [Tilletiaria anomala UBC 951]KDN44892.1 cryptochrome [Tilletiaria anomala UBC 951]
MSTPVAQSSTARPTVSAAGTWTEEEGGRSILICLLRLDLRIHDNALFHYAHRPAAPPTRETWFAELCSASGQSTGASGDSEAFSRWADEASLHSQAQYLLPVYVFDEREIELSGFPGYKREGPEARTKEYGFWKMSGFRARFTAESVYDLRSRLVERGSNLLIRFGKPEKVIANLVTALQAQGDFVEGVWIQKEITHAEVQVENEIRTALNKRGVPLRFVHGKTLIHPVDLPFDVKDTPDVFTPFRKRVEQLGARMARPTLDSPARFKPFPTDLPETGDYKLDITYEVDVDGLQKLKTLSKKAPQQNGDISFYDILRYILLPLNDSNLSPILEGPSILQKRHPASALPLRGGESSALERLEWYFIRGKSADSSRWDRNDPPPVARYKQTRNNLVGHAYSTKMSPFLSYGSISPRQIWEALDYHEHKFGEDQNTYWVRFELLWRDYFFFVAEKFGVLLFHLGGFELVTDPAQAEKKLQPGWWRGWDPMQDGPEHDVTRLLDGRTGIPFLDANIIELRESGFMSNRGRQNIASFLTKDLGCDWRIGAEFFQSHLIDYDPTSNYGNWQYVSGVGNDPRASRQFNTIKQAKDYDSYGEYVMTWIPALRNMHPAYVHTPWLLDPEERRRYGLKTTEMDVTAVGYPACPMLEIESWKKHYERKEGVGSKMRGNPQEKVKDGKLRKVKPHHHHHLHTQQQPVQARGQALTQKPTRSSRGFAATDGMYALGSRAFGMQPHYRQQQQQQQKQQQQPDSGSNSQSDRESPDNTASTAYDSQQRHREGLPPPTRGGGFVGGILRTAATSVVGTGSVAGSSGSGTGAGVGVGAYEGRSSSPFGGRLTSAAAGPPIGGARPSRAFANGAASSQLPAPGSAGAAAAGAGFGLGSLGSVAGRATSTGWRAQAPSGMSSNGSAQLGSGTSLLRSNAPAGASGHSPGSGGASSGGAFNASGAVSGNAISKADSETSWRKAPGT